MTSTTATSTLERARTGSWADLTVFAALVWGMALGCALVVHGSADFAQLDSAPGWVWGVLILISWVPALAALGTQLIRTGSVRGFASGWRWPALRWILLGLAVPCGYTTAITALTWLSDAGTLDLSAFTHAATDALGSDWAPLQVVALCYAILTIVGGTLALSVFSLGEELGWSGFVIPRLLPTLGITRTALVTGLLWSSYHFPLILLAKNFTQGTPIGFTMIGLTVALTGVAFVSTWLRARTISIWPAVLMHASHNVWFFYLYEPLTSAKPLTPYVGGEHGVGMMLVAIVLGILVTRAAKSSASARVEATP